MAVESIEIKDSGSPERVAYDLMVHIGGKETAGDAKKGIDPFNREY